MRKKQDSKKKTNKHLRRHLRRLAERKGISYKDAIMKFYDVNSIKLVEKNLLYSLYK